MGHRSARARDVSWLLAVASRLLSGSASRAVSPIVIATLLGVVAVFLSAQVWWGSHNCYT
jgi:hypothetical protein